MKRFSSLIITAIGSFALSMLAKVLADAYLDEYVSIIGAWAGLRYSQNPGVAFGIRMPDIIELPLILLAFGFVFVLARKHATSRMSMIGYGSIIGGAAGNIADRLFDGMVTDFVRIGTFPIFNVADSCITIGVLLLIAESVAVSLRAGQTKE